MTNIIALLTALGFFMFYGLTTLVLIPLALLSWALKKVIAGIKWVQESIV
ncbi:exported hypothetical protein [Cupriavidus phytorum]|uniref:Uncharacterized protein n=1 Tax=Cupriavidus taiwanensis TaxID=164546 RepID=A0A975XC60_9BURK|nr:hypothetical protein [Cupriavidus taiwanensis]SOY65613.1 exported hypothetical protein [Cupriavidus taiwanensis]